MRQGLQAHRLAANIQPGNVPSIALAASCGFQKEGYSPCYLKVRRRDHERWAILADRLENAGLAGLFLRSEWRTQAGVGRAEEEGACADSGGTSVSFVMILLLQLLRRIATGERLEKGSRENTAWWLALLVTMPLAVAIMMGCFAGLEHSEYSHLLDTMPGLVGMVVLMVVILIVLQALCVRTFRRRPLWLLPIAMVIWGGGLWWFLAWL
jgi:hypothetical protein